MWLKQPGSSLTMNVETGLSLGSNLGNRLANLKEARRLIAASEELSLAAQASVYETEPLDVPETARGLWFLNTVIVLKTSFSGMQLLRFLQTIEKKLGRTDQSVCNQPRPIDIDIIYFGDQVIQTKQLQVPHPRWFERRFVLQPLAEIRPDLHLPGKTESVQKILTDARVRGALKLYLVDW